VEIYLALLKERCLQDGAELTEESLGKQFRLPAELGMPVNRRYSGGQDIDGGCGMLAGNSAGMR
jgi:hypothetical protein